MPISRYGEVERVPYTGPFYIWWALWLALVLCAGVAPHSTAQSGSSGSYRATYGFTYVTDTVSMTEASPTTYVLLSNGTESRFFAENWSFNDSMRALDLISFPEPTVPTQESIQSYVNAFAQRMSKWKKPVLGDEFQVQKLVREDVVKVGFPVPPHRYMAVPTELDWVIGDETRSVAGYPCIRATTHYGGRDYEAWFAPTIPVPDGPYVFGGLPGLVVSVRDERGWYKFELARFEADPGTYHWPTGFIDARAERIDRATFVREIGQLKDNFSLPGAQLSAEDVARLRAARASRYYLLLEQND